MRPFFSYFGGKWGLSKHYPPPEHGVIVEPFAGSAGYATRYADRRVILIDQDPIIVAIWRYLIAARASEILALPLEVEDADALPVCQEARWLIGFWIARGVTTPRTKPTTWMRSRRWPTSFWGLTIRERIARQIEHIRHWQVIEGDYTAAPCITATWLIDPPYEQEGRHYRFHEIDYPALAGWTRARCGLVIACEAVGATWLPFAPFRRIKSLARSMAHEAVYIQRTLPPLLAHYAR